MLKFSFCRYLSSPNLVLSDSLLVFSSLGPWLSWRRHRRPWPLSVAAVGAGLLLYPFHHAFDVTLWVGMVYIGLALLFSAATLDSWLICRADRSCSFPGNSR